MKRNGFSMIELVFVIVILGVLAAVAVPRFVATRTDAQVATARSDASSAIKAIVAKVFADDIDPTYSVAPDPNMKAADALAQGKTMNWGDWMIEVAGLDKSRWMSQALNGNAKYPGISPLGNMQRKDNGAGGKGSCGTLMYIDYTNGNLVFDPNNLMSRDLPGVGNGGTFCTALKASYKNSTDAGNRTIPLASTNTISF